jgi:hypothetical protein
MKRFSFLAILTLSVYAVTAQKYEDIKNLLLFSKYAQAKTDIDKAMTNAKFTSKAEAYILKTTIYAGLAMDGATKNTPAAEQYTTDADVAFKKYQEMEPAMGLIKDPIYQNGPINLYSSFYSLGYTDYTEKKWETSFQKFKKAAEMSDLLIGQKLINATLDTNVLILAGLTAENSNNKDEAAKYYLRLADKKVTGEGFESVYRFLVNHYFAKKDITAFEKYKALGGELFPKSEYFKYDKIDFAIGLETDFNAKIRAVEAVLATDPNNYKANEVMGEIIYDTLNSHAKDPVMPANADELEKKMVEAFMKAAAGKPGTETPYLFIGDHFISKGVKINDAREAHVKAMKERTKPGTAASKEDIAKRDLLDKQYGDALEGAREPYEKAAEIFAGRTTLDIRDKQQYKKAASYLADIFAYKKTQATGKPADIAKYAAEETKWNARYDSIK